MYQRSQFYQKWQNPANRQKIFQQVKPVIELEKELNPAARRLLLTIHTLLEQNNFKPVNRAAIAAMLQHPARLHRHDRNLLRLLETKGFISSARAALPLLKDGQPRGYELVYRMEIDIAWIISRIRKSATKPGA